MDHCFFIEEEEALFFWEGSKKVGKQRSSKAMIKMKIVKKFNNM